VGAAFRFPGAVAAGNKMHISPFRQDPRPLAMSSTVTYQGQIPVFSVTCISTRALCGTGTVEHRGFAPIIPVPVRGV
jgi:hypothetical protein